MQAGAVHLGGGTPNMLNPDELAAIFGALRRTFQFTPDVEIAAELDPAVFDTHLAADAERHSRTG